MYWWHFISFGYPCSLSDPQAKWREKEKLLAISNLSNPPEWRIALHSCTSLSWISISPVLDSLKAMSLKYYHMWENVIFSPDGTDHNFSSTKKERHDTWHQYLCSLALSKRKITLLFWSERKSQRERAGCTVLLVSLLTVSSLSTWNIDMYFLIAEHRKSNNTKHCLAIFYNYISDYIFLCFKTKQSHPEFHKVRPYFLN